MQRRASILLCVLALATGGTVHAAKKPICVSVSVRNPDADPAEHAATGKAATPGQSTAPAASITQAPVTAPIPDPPDTPSSAVVSPEEIAAAATPPAQPLPMPLQPPLQRQPLHLAQTQLNADIPLGQNPISYLKRLIEYFVTHEPGFIAVENGCEEHIDVELYPLREGWTGFARYSGNGREERVDYLFADELSQFAERASLALLYDKPISSTIKRDTVLRADSKKAVQRIRGTHHFVMGLGTELRGGRLPTVQDDGSAKDELRVFSPISLGLGYRGKFENWGLETVFGLAIGTSKSGLQTNDVGGHVDYGGNVNFALHFLRYLNPRGLTSFYVGAGGSFEVMWFYQIKEKELRSGGDRSTIPSGGFDVDLLMGVEFMRASRVQFYLQGAVLVPAYLVENGDGPSNLKTWLPGAALTMGMLF